MTQGTRAICTRCKNRDHENMAEMVCKAFPEEIPEEILIGEDDHSKPFPGQIGGYVFEDMDI